MGNGHLRATIPFWKVRGLEAGKFWPKYAQIAIINKILGSYVGEKIFYLVFIGGSVNDVLVY